MEPDAGQRLDFRNGSLTPVGRCAGRFGLRATGAVVREGDGERADFALCMALVIWWGWRCWCGAGRHAKACTNSAPAISSARCSALAAFLLALIRCSSSWRRWLETWRSLCAARRDIPRAGATGRQRADRGCCQRVGKGVGVGVDRAGVARRCWRWWLWGFAWTVGQNGLAAVAGCSAGRCSRGRRCSCPNGAAAFFCVLAVFLVLHIVVPALKRLWQLPRTAAQARICRRAPKPAARRGGGVCC